MERRVIMIHESNRYPRNLWPMLKAARTKNRREFQAQWKHVNVDKLSKALRNEYEAAKRVCAYPYHIKETGGHQFHAPVIAWAPAKHRDAGEAQS